MKVVVAVVVLEINIIMEDVLAAVQALAGKFDGLSERIDLIEQKSNEVEASRSDTNLSEGARPSRSRSR